MPRLPITQGDYDALEEKDPSTEYWINEHAEPFPPTSTDAATRDYERLVAGGMNPQQAAATARAALHQRTLREQETMPNPDTERAEAHARYHSALHTQQARTIRIDADGLDAGIYVELLRMITDRWPKAKLSGGGIAVPEEKDGADISISAPLPGTKAAATHQRPHESTHHAYPSYWQRSANEHLLTVLADASRLPLAAVAHSLAEHGQHSPDPHTAIAAFIRDHKLAKPAERKPHFDTKEYWTTGDHLTLTRALADVNNEPLEYVARTLAGLTGGNRGPYGALDVYIRDRGRKYEWNTAAAWGSTAMNQTVDALAKAADIPRSNVISALIRHGQVCTTPAETVAAFVTGTGLRRP